MDHRESEIDGLLEEHRQLITTLGALRRVAEDAGADMLALLDKLERQLADHTEREEVGLFHTLGEVEVGPEYLGLFEHDHDHLIGLIASVRADRQHVGDLITTFEGHMAREEADMFPAAEQLLGPDEWNAIDAAVAHVRSR
jgi:hypothetical protein